MNADTKQSPLEAIVIRHTPGPWKVHVMAREITVDAPCGREVFRASRGADAEVLGDARLISAAPDLLAALVALLDGYGYTSFLSDEEKESQQEVIAARNAIAKAIGRSDNANSAAGSPHNEPD